MTSIGDSCYFEEAALHRKFDSDIQDDVIRELRWDSRVDPTSIGVTVHEGIVTLTGVVSSYAERVAAKEASHRVNGVLDVANDIQVRVPGSKIRTDTEIATAVRQALEWDALVPAELIQTTVSNGWVTLEGSVNTFQQKDDAERSVRYLAGVHGLTNSIAVKAAPVDADDLRTAIEQALERRAEREARRISVRVDNGTVVLQGPINSWEERRAIIGLVGHAPGVTAVVDELTQGQQQ